MLQAPLTFLTDPSVRHTVTHPSGYRGPAFQLGDDLLLWGFTAGVVDQGAGARGAGPVLGRGP